MTKKILILFCCAFIFSCSSDDEAVVNTDDNVVVDEAEMDPIIGSWSPLKHITVYANGSTTEEILSSCEQTDTMTFLANGELDMSLNYDYEDGCEIEITTIEGNWTQLDETRYSIYAKVYYDDDINDTETQTSVLDVSFPENSVMYVHDEETVSYYQGIGVDVVDYYTLLNKN